MSEPTNPEVAILNAALELPAAERSAYLDQACAGAAALRTQVEALLKADAQAEGFLEAPPAGFDFKRTVQLNIPLTEKPGDRIGRYKLLQQIGEGGCGVVYMAEQEEPVRRRVALKVIKLGMDTKSVIARFEAERQALALMDHPNIAKIFDAGITEAPLPAFGHPLPVGRGEGRGEGTAISQPSTLNSQLSPGRPYFVMELVRGIKITDFCDENKLSTEERLKLFIQVCQAIQHAHQKGVIHRDIKPSNILVTVNDGVPVPKVIDFGIAKATAGRLTDHTLFTAFEQFIGTPAYMSPEQAVMTSLDIDTRSDIYSLGVLLYELLTGRTPFDQKELLAAGLDEMRRTIREKEPPKPSTVVERLSKLKVERGEAPAPQGSSALNSQLKSLSTDLDWIVMKSLEKDRSRRYETANGLASDLQRHLNCEPVLARPPSRLYEFQKTVRRHKFGFAAGAAVFIVLALGVIASTLEAIRAKRAEREQIRLRHIAETKEIKSDQVAQFLKDMLDGVGPSVALGRDTTMLREILDKVVDQLGTGLSNQPEVEAELRTTIGEVYEALAETDKAAAMHRRALELRRKTLGNSALEVAESLNNLALELHHQSKLDESDVMLQEALRIERELLADAHPLTAASLSGLAYVRLWQGRLEESESLYRKVLAMRRKLYGNENLDVADTLNNLALAITARGRLAEAESMLHDSLAMKRKLVKQDDEDIAMTLYNLADALQRGREFEEAAAAFRESLTIRRRILGDKHPNVTITINRLDAVLAALASRLGAEGKFAQAEPVARERLALLEKQSPDDWRTFLARSDLGGNLLAEGTYTEAEPLLLAGYEGMKEREHQIPTNAVAQLVEAAGRLAQLYESTGQTEKAAELKKRQELAQAAAQTRAEAATRSASGIAHARHGAFAEAIADFARVIELRPGDHEVWHWQAATLVQSGQLDAYRELRRRSVELFGHTTDPNTADRIAKDYLMLPSSEADVATAAKMAETAVNAATNHPDMTCFQFCKGLAEYRQGHFAGSVDWLQKVLVHAGDDSNRDVEARMVLAMAQYRSKQTDEASATLAKGVEIVESKLPKLDSGDLGEGWLDWIIAHALMREAKALIESQPATATEKKAEPH